MPVAYRHTIFACEHGCVKFYPPKKNQTRDMFVMPSLRVQSVCPGCGGWRKERARMAEAEQCLQNVQDNLSARLQGLSDETFSVASEMDVDSEESWPAQPAKPYSLARILRETEAQVARGDQPEEQKLSLRIRRIREDLERRMQSWDRTEIPGERKETLPENAAEAEVVEVEAETNEAGEAAGASADTFTC